MSRRRSDPSLIADDVLARLAYIFGSQSASAGALAEMTRRRATGEDAVCYQCGEWFFVGPRADLDTPLSDRSRSATCAS